MLTVNPLPSEEIQTLEEMYKNHPCHTSRTRAHAILSSDVGFKLKEIASIYNICRQTAATWLHDWKDNGICGLFDKPRSGRPRMLCNEAEAEIDVITRVIEAPRSLKKVLAELTASLGLTVSPSVSTLKRICKRAKLNWKRVRKSLRSKRDPDLFEQSRQQLVVLIEQSKQKDIDLFYFDESGFTLEPCVPYAWQPRGETIEVPCAKSKRLNVLGFVNRECSFTSVVFEGSITTAVVVASIDHFIPTLQRQTALVMDNASIHKSFEFQENIERWQQQGLTIVNIAPYSPELNIIEILWRKIKYEWMLYKIRIYARVKYSTNHRTDEYGGSQENRTRLLLEITAAITSIWGAERVGVRLSPISPANDIADSNPASLFIYVVEQLNQFDLLYLHLIEGATGGARQVEKGFDLQILRQLFKGIYIGNNGYDRELAVMARQQGLVDLVAFGRLFISNPDLVARLQSAAPHNELDANTLYGGGAKGYTDYPFLDDQKDG